MSASAMMDAMLPLHTSVYKSKRGGLLYTLVYIRCILGVYQVDSCIHWCISGVCQVYIRCLSGGLLYTLMYIRYISGVYQVDSCIHWCIHGCISGVYQVDSCIHGCISGVYLRCISVSGVYQVYIRWTPVYTGVYQVYIRCISSGLLYTLVYTRVYIRCISQVYISIRCISSVYQVDSCIHWCTSGIRGVHTPERTGVYKTNVHFHIY